MFAFVLCRGVVCADVFVVVCVCVCLCMLLLLVRGVLLVFGL